jgi:PPOX class probable F420-dependent enzyme
VTLPDPSTPLGEVVHRRLREDPVVWLTTIGAGGTPQPNPVWFLWDGETILVYSTPAAHRLLHVRERPHVALHLDGSGGRGVVIVTGRAVLVPDEPPADRMPAFMAKYGGLMAMTPAQWAAAFSVALRVGQLRVRGHVRSG